MKKALIILLAIVAGGVLFTTLRGGRGSETPNYRYVTVEQGDLESVVSSTGTLDAVVTVQVGTQVSGIVDEICVDFNDRVSEGQVVARIDTLLLANAVAGAEAQLARSEAELRQARREFERIEALEREELVSESEYSQALYALDVAEASVQSSNVDLTRTRRNLDYATITAPIAGTVISRSVDVGQTVQSSFSAPELFLIAGDLEHMQILASVDESDVGQIAEGQTARFTVQAYPDDEFVGTVRQMRLQSATEENVVNYTAVIDVDNPDLRLLPGMTATVDFLVETASDVTYVPNAALRYRPDAQTMSEALERMRAARQDRGRGQGGAGGDDTNRPGGMGGGEAPADRGLLWTLDDDGELVPVPVRTGISNGTNTMVVGRNLEVGLSVIAGVSSSSAQSSSSGSPFQQQNGGQRSGPPSPGGF